MDIITKAYLRDLASCLHKSVAKRYFFVFCQVEYKLIGFDFIALHNMASVKQLTLRQLIKRLL